MGTSKVQIMDVLLTRSSLDVEYRRKPSVSPVSHQFTDEQRPGRLASSSQLAVSVNLTEEEQQVDAKKAFSFKLTKLETSCMTDVNAVYGYNEKGITPMVVDPMRKLFAILIVGLFAGALSACEEQGPAEQAGEAVDSAVDQAGEAAEEATSN